MVGERNTSVFPEYKVDAPMVWPDYRFDVEGCREDADGEGVALVILRNPEDPEILLGLHNSRDSEKHGRWSFFGETRKSGEESGLATLARGMTEELNLDLSQLEVLAYNPEKILRILDKIPRRSQYYPGTKLFTVGTYTVWMEDDYCRQVETNEIIETKFFPLANILGERVTILLREYTLPALNKLNALGILDSPNTSLRPINLPL